MITTRNLANLSDTSDDTDTTDTTESTESDEYITAPDYADGTDLSINETTGDTLESNENKTYGIIHIHNKNDMYHLTKQCLVDSSITQCTFCFFYQIISLDIDEFNSKYGSFALMIHRNEIETDLYLNVNSNALSYLIEYIQTNKFNYDNLSKGELVEIMDLAILFGMANFVEQIKEIISGKKRNKHYKYLINFVLSACLKLFGIRTLTEEHNKLIEAYVKTYGKTIKNNYFKNMTDSDELTAFCTLIRSIAINDTVSINDTVTTNEKSMAEIIDDLEVD